MKKSYIIICIFISVLLFLCLTGCSSIIELIRILRDGPDYDTDSETDTDTDEEIEFILAGNNEGEITPEAGGFLTAMDNEGTMVEIIIPPYAVTVPVSASLTMLEKPPKDMFDTHIFPGFTLEPHGLKLKRFAEVQVTFKDRELAGDSLLLYIPSEDKAVPVLLPEVRDNILSGQLHHFSEYTGSSTLPPEILKLLEEATLAEKIAMFDRLVAPPGMEDIYEFLNNVKKLETGAIFCITIGKTPAEVEIMIGEMADKAAATLFRTPIPANPCGDYKDVLVMFAPYLYKYSIKRENVPKYRKRMEDVFAECPIKGHQKMYISFYGLNAGTISLRMVRPIELEQKEDNKIKGGGPNQFLMNIESVGGDGAVYINGEFNMDIKLEGEVRITEDLRAQVVTWGNSDDVTGFINAEVSVPGEGMQTIFVSQVTADTMGDTTTAHATVYTPLGIYTGTGTSSGRQEKIIHNYVNGDQWVKRVIADGAMVVCRLVLYFNPK